MSLIYFSCFAQIIVKTAPGHFSMICVDMLSRLNHPVEMREKDIVSDATTACDHFCIPTQQKTAKVCKGRQASVFLVCAQFKGHMDHSQLINQQGQLIYLDLFIFRLILSFKQCAIYLTHSDRGHYVLLFFEHLSTSIVFLRPK